MAGGLLEGAKELVGNIDMSGVADKLGGVADAIGEKLGDIEMPDIDMPDVGEMGENLQDMVDN